MKTLLIWAAWLALVLYWLSPEIETVRDKVSEHNQQIERAINE